MKIHIQNPYQDVIWGHWGAYLAQLHCHSNAGDGNERYTDVIEEHYKAGYDVLAMAEHGVVCRGWVGRPNYLPVMQWAQQKINKGHGPPVRGLTLERFDEITQGTDRNGHGMTRVPHAIEQNPVSLNKAHVVSWFADWGSAWWGGSWDYTNAVRGVHRAGGVSVIAHPADTCGFRKPPLSEAFAGKNAYYIWKIQRLLEKYPSLLGIEIPEAADRKLWDILLSHLGPTGRNITAIQTSDLHKFDRIMRGYTWMMMPENKPEHLRPCLESGAVLAGGCFIEKKEEIDRWKRVLPNYKFKMEHAWWADQSAAKPMVIDIQIDGSTMSIAHENALGVQWISGGEQVCMGDSIDLAAVHAAGKLGCYVRAELLGEGGLLCTQAFLLRYDGMPAPTLTPKSFFDWGYIPAILRIIFFWPAGKLTDWLHHVIYKKEA